MRGPRRQLARPCQAMLCGTGSSRLAPARSAMRTSVSDWPSMESCPCSASRPGNASCTPRRPGGGTRESHSRGTWTSPSLSSRRVPSWSRTRHSTGGRPRRLRRPEQLRAQPRRPARARSRLFGLRSSAPRPFADHCSVCGASGDEFRVMDVAQPLGFRTSYWPRDYNGRRGIGRSPRVRGCRDTGLDWDDVREPRCTPGARRPWSASTTTGGGFRFGDFAKGAPYSLGEGLISLDVVDNAGLAGGQA